MLTLDLKARMKNKAFIVAFVSAIMLLLQQMGLKQYIPSNWLDILNTTLTILMLLGAVVDTSTPGISDQIIADTTVDSVNKSENTKKEVQAEDSTTAVNNEISEDSQEITEENATSTVNSNIPR